MLPALLLAQTINGTVKGGKETLVGANVIAVTAENKTVAYAITNDKGQFKLVVPASAKADKVNVSYIGFQRKSIPFAEMKNGMTITLSEGGFKLKEVKVKAERIVKSSDTITYSVAGFKQAQDRSIADVIAKMPGLEVKKDGQIQYQGKSINKFYIEGQDLMGGQYGQASKNISAEKIKSVQVLENHQPVKSLRGVSFSDQAALNIVLKDEAKAVWSGTMDLGPGYGDDFLYDNRVMAMRFSRRFQTLMMYKNNNTGENLSNEVRDLVVLGRESTIDGSTGVLNLLSVGSADLSRERYTFNQSHLVAGNWLWKTGKDSNLRMSGNGFLDKQNMQSYHTTTYLTLEGMPVITEEQEATSWRNQWKGNMNYTYNGSKTYLYANVSGFADFNRSEGFMDYNGTITPMNVKPRKRSLSENLQLSHTTSSGNVYEIRSNSAYNYLPGQLLTVDHGTEQLDIKSLTSQNEMTTRLRIGKSYLDNLFGMAYQNQDIQVSFPGVEKQGGAYEFTQLYWRPSYRWQRKNFRVSLDGKITYTHQQYKTNKRKDFWVDPYLSLYYKSSAVSEWRLSTTYRTTPRSGLSVYDTPVFTSYRSMQVNSGKPDVTHTQSVIGSYSYSNPVKGLFFNISPNYSKLMGNMLYTTAMNGRVYVSTATDRKADTSSMGISGRISKSLSWAKTVIALNASYTTSDYSMLVADQLHDARMNTWSSALTYSLRPFQLMSVEGKTDLMVRKQQNLSQKSLSSGSIADWEHSLNLNIFPARKWMITWENELFHSSEKSFGTNYFCDLLLSYKAKRWEISFRANNLLGTSEYERRSLGDTIESYSMTVLRPREFLMKWSVDL